MTAQHLNDVKLIARLATNLGATLPSRITTGLAHLEALAADAQTPPQPGPAAKELSLLLGQPAALEKARKSAALALATADASAKIDAYLVYACASRLRAQMRGDAEAIAAAIGAALKPDLETLQSEAPKLPQLFRPEHADQLDARTFESWTLARDASARIRATQQALDTLYGGVLDQDTEAHFPAHAQASLRFAKPPHFDGAHGAHDFRDALAGRSQAMDGRGPTSIDGLFIPTTLAYAGATFAWATPAAVSQRARQTADAIRELQVVA